MADPLSIGASIVAFIQVAEGVIRASSFCITAIQDAPLDLQMILCEVTSLKFIVEGFKSRPEWHGSLSDNANAGFLSRLFARSGPVEACMRCLSELNELLPFEARRLAASDSPSCSLMGNNSENLKRRAGHWRILAAQLAWPLKQSKARRLLAELSHHKATLLLAISGDIAHDLKDIQTTLGRLSDVVSASDKREIFRWLEQSQTNPSVMHNSTYRKHEPHTSGWLLSLPEWEDWLAPTGQDVNHSRSLWIHGPPGTGKTVLASFIIEQVVLHCEVTLPSSSAKNVRAGYSYYYCHYSHDQDESVPFLSWTLSQACRQSQSQTGGWIPGELKRLYDRGREPSIPDLERCLEIVLEKLDVFYVVVDAVDESNPRSELVNLIATLVLDTRFRKLRVLVTSRPYFEIERVFGGIFGNVLSMSNPFVEADIREMVRSRLAGSFRLRRWKDMHRGIEDVLVARAGGMFQWVECQIRKIENLRDISQLQETLRDLPVDLAETYTRILAEIPIADREFVRRVLIWVVGHSNAAWISDDGINAELLVSAAEYDLYGRAASGKKHTHRMFDVEQLRELCSCLLTFKCISDEEEDDHNETGGANADAADRNSVMSEWTLVSNDNTNIKSRTGSPDTSRKVYMVSISHYTVVEFLESPYILSNPSVSYFSLPPGTIRYEFATSVFRQALAADPTVGLVSSNKHGNPKTTSKTPIRNFPKETDWETDREAYCLTLGCALAFMGPEDLAHRLDIDGGEADELVDLVLRYFDPSMPHFGRFRAIQRRIALDPLVSGVYYLGTLPSGFDITCSGAGVHGLWTRSKEDQKREMAARTLLCMMSMSLYRYKDSLISRCMNRLVQLSGVRHIDELMDVRVKGFRTLGAWFHRDWDRDMTVHGIAGGEGGEGDNEGVEGEERTYSEVVFEGTVRQALLG